MGPVDRVLTRFPLAVVVYFSRLREVIAKFFFVWIVTESVERCEEDGLSSLFTLSSSSDESWFED